MSNSSKTASLDEKPSLSDASSDKDSELAQILQREEVRYSTRKRGQPVSYATEFPSIRETSRPAKKAKKHKKEVREVKKTELTNTKNTNQVHNSGTDSIDSILRNSFIRFLKEHKLERTQEALGIAQDQDLEVDLFQEIFQWEDCLSTDRSSAFNGVSLTRFREETCDIVDRNPDLVWNK